MEALRPYRPSPSYGTSPFGTPSFGRLTTAYGLAILLFVGLMGHVPVMAIPEATYDDALFVRQALHLVSGQWLGPYDNMTLAKGPFYPVWIAFGWALGLPILVSQGMAYALSCWLLVRGLRPWLWSEATAFAVFLLLLFNPITYSLGQLRVMREGIYVPLTVLVFALAVWWFRLRDRSLPVRAGLAAALGAVLGMLWCTREEGVWVVPSLAAAFGLILLLRLGEAAQAAPPTGRRLRAAFVPAGREAALAAVSAGVAALLVAGVGWVNLQRYGVSDVVEFKQQEFLSAYGALSRVRHRQAWKPYVVIPRDTLERAYAVSPAAAELRPYFDGSAPDVFLQVGCATYGVTPCDGEIRAGWFMWALRDAAAQAGHYRSAAAARDFYARLAQEIAVACDDGRLECLPPRATMIPPFRNGYIAPTLQAVRAMVTMMATLQSATIPKPMMSCLVEECGQQPSRAVFFDMIHTTRFVNALWLPASKPQGDGGVTLPTLQLGDVVARGLENVVEAYRAVLPWALWAALAAYLAGGVIAIRRRRAEPLFLVATVCASLTASRIGLLAYLEAVAIPSVNTLYLSPAFPALLLFAITAILALVGQVGARRSKDQASWGEERRPLPGPGRSGQAKKRLRK